MIFVHRRDDSNAKDNQNIGNILNIGTYSFINERVWWVGGLGQWQSTYPVLHPWYWLKKSSEYSFGHERGLKGNVSKLIYNFCVIPTHCIE